MFDWLKKKEKDFDFSVFAFDLGGDEPGIQPLAVLKTGGQTLPVLETPAVFGRNDEEVDIYFFHESISRRHCEFSCSEGALFVADLGSFKGTLADNKPVGKEPVKVDNGAVIKIGKVKFTCYVNYPEIERRAAERLRAELEARNAKEQAPVVVVAREVNVYEYEESEVMTVDCGFGEAEADEMPKAAVEVDEMPPAEVEMVEVPQPEVEKVETPPEEAEAVKVPQPEVEKVEIPQAEVEADEIPKPEVEEEDESETPVDVDIVIEPAEPDPFTTVQMDPVIIPEPTQAHFDDIVYGKTASLAEEEFSEKTEVLYAATAELGMGLCWEDAVTGQSDTIKIDHTPFTIGRKADVNDYAIDIRGVSRSHMYITEANGRFYVCDRKSTNGVEVNGVKIMPLAEIEIKEGDVLKIAGREYRFKKL